MLDNKAMPSNSAGQQQEKTMKTLITIIITALLTACGGGEALVMADKAEAVQVEAQTVETTPPAAPIPEKCNTTTYNPCFDPTLPLPAPVVACNPKDAGCVVPDGMEYCDIWSYNPCAHPTWIPKQPVAAPVSTTQVSVK
jgi:hypothetical protein